MANQNTVSSIWKALCILSLSVSINFIPTVKPFTIRFSLSHTSPQPQTQFALDCGNLLIFLGPFSLFSAGLRNSILVASFELPLIHPLIY